MDNPSFTPEELKEIWIRAYCLLKTTKGDTIEGAMLRDAYRFICNGVDILQGNHSPKAGHY